MKIQEKWLFCYWDDPIFDEKETTKINNKLNKNEENNNYSSRKKSTD